MYIPGITEIYHLVTAIILEAEKMLRMRSIFLTTSLVCMSRTKL